jgi:hypothetical protein
MMALRKNLLLKSPRSRRLEGRIAVIQHPKIGFRIGSWMPRPKAGHKRFGIIAYGN